MVIKYYLKDAAVSNEKYQVSGILSELYSGNHTWNNI